MDRPFRVGIVGGRRGESFVLGLRGRVEIAAVCDIDSQRLEDTANQAGVTLRFSDFTEMLDTARLDIVIISTPMPLHVPQAVAALERGVHVLSEVPAATDLEQCWQLVEAVRTSRAKYMMAENCCYLKSSVLVRAMADAGVFGELYYGDGAYIHELKSLNEQTPWRRFWQTGINGSTYSTHTLGPMLQWMRTRVLTVSCIGSGHHHVDASGRSYANEDSTTMICKLATGGMVTVRLDMLSERPANLPYYSYSVQGTRGCFEGPRAADETYRVWIKDKSPDHETWQSLWEFENEFLPTHWQNPPEAVKAAGHEGSDYFQVVDFVDSILSNSKPPIDVYDALDFTVPGLVSQESIRRESIPLPVPDFRAIKKFPDDLPVELKNSSILRVRQDT